MYFLVYWGVSIYLIKRNLINAVSEAVILSTLSYQEAWEMVGFPFFWHLFICLHPSFNYIQAMVRMRPLFFLFVPSYLISYKLQH
jgi:hypothetical protein